MSSRPLPERFYELPEPEQIEGLADLAREAVTRWGLRDAGIRPVAYRENMTFRVDSADRGRFALRIHQAGYRTDAQIQSELAFMEALRERGVGTPEVVPAADGAPFVHVESRRVPEVRQCDLFEWIDGRLLRAAGGEPSPGPELERSYRELGRQAAAISNAAEEWPRPAGFSRRAWDAEGIFGRDAHLGDFRKLPILTAAQLSLLERLVERLAMDLEGFGKSPDRYGLSHGDFLPENILVCPDGIRLIDFDDCGDGWTLFDFATALFDLMGNSVFDSCLTAMVTGYREQRELPDAHLALLPAFFLARAVSYLGWSATRSHLEKAAQIAPRLIELIEASAPPYLAGEGG